MPEPFDTRRLEPLALPLLLFVAAVLRLWGIEDTDVWVDEANSVLIARVPFSELPGRLAVDSSPPFYYVLLRGWMMLFGDSLLAIRSLSVIASVALVGATWAFGRRLWSPTAGFFGGWVVATSSLQIAYAQQARMYALLPLLALASVGFLVLYLREGRRSHFWAWFATTLLGLYTHNFALYLLPVHAVLILATGSPRQRLRAFAPAVLLGALACAPWIPFFLEQLENRDHYAWFLPIWEHYGVSGAINATLIAWAPGGEYVLIDLPDVPRSPWPGLLLAAVAILGAAQLVLRRRESDRLALLWIPAYLLMPPLLALAAAQVLTPHYVPGRVDQLMLPAYALLCGLGFELLRPAVLRALLALVLLALCMQAVGVYPVDLESRGFRGSDRQLADDIASRLRDGDVILTTSLSRASLEYYLGRRSLDPPIVSFPRETAGHLGAQNDARFLRDQAGLEREARAALDEARSHLVPGGRLFVVFVHSPVNAPVSSARLARTGLLPVQKLGPYYQNFMHKSVEVSVHRTRR